MTFDNFTFAEFYYGAFVATNSSPAILLNRYDNFYTLRKGRKRLGVHYRAVLAPKEKFRRWQELLDYTYPNGAIIKGADGDVAFYGCFVQGVGTERNWQFLKAGKVYARRKRKKIYTFSFVKGYVRSWGYDLR